VSRYPHRLQVVAVAARQDHPRLWEVVRRVRPALVGISQASSPPPAGADGPWRVVWGPHALEEVALFPQVDLVVAATPGLYALRAVLAALKSGRPVALANKEVLVAGGELVARALREGGSVVLPVDSEHVALHQSLRDERPEAVARLWLTASGGPFRTWPPERLALATPQEALRHPRWDMGPLITVNSATLMNKGLEVLEAHLLFGLPLDAIQVVVHPESVVHSLVEMVDGSWMSQWASADMRLPIQYALLYPDRHRSGVAPLDLPSLGSLHFETVRQKDFPSLSMAVAAGRMGGTAPAVLVAANEEAVGAFLEGRIGFMDIPVLVSQVFEQAPAGRVTSAEDVEEADAWARRALAERVRRPSYGRAGSGKEG
jgi:1-deoxy-D-xylulose-5-phosphate reductoisomerase